MNLDWRWYAWHELDPDTLYGFLQLRSAAFVIEQNCLYTDMDDRDQAAEHLCVRDRDGAMLAYLRLLPPDAKHGQPSLGRLVVAREARGEGLARAIAREGIRVCQIRYPEADIRISGQQHLEGFYASVGFQVVSPPYVDDGIWHVDMLLRWAR